MHAGRSRTPALTAQPRDSRGPAGESLPNPVRVQSGTGIIAQSRCAAVGDNPGVIDATPAPIHGAGQITARSTVAGEDQASKANADEVSVQATGGSAQPGGSPTRRRPLCGIDRPARAPPPHPGQPRPRRRHRGRPRRRLRRANPAIEPAARAPWIDARRRPQVLAMVEEDIDVRHPHLPRSLQPARVISVVPHRPPPSQGAVQSLRTSHRQPLHAADELRPTVPLDDEMNVVGLDRVNEHPEPRLVRPRKRPLQRRAGLAIPHVVDVGPCSQGDQHRVPDVVRGPGPVRRRPPPPHQLPPRPPSLPTPASGQRQTKLSRATSEHGEPTPVLGNPPAELRPCDTSRSPGGGSVPFRGRCFSPVGASSRRWGWLAPR